MLHIKTDGGVINGHVGGATNSTYAIALDTWANQLHILAHHTHTLAYIERSARALHRCAQERSACVHVLRSIEAEPTGEIEGPNLLCDDFKCILRKLPRQWQCKLPSYPTDCTPGAIPVSSIDSI